jgi:hypothetical protein
MAEALDHEDEIYRKLWEAFEAYEPFTETFPVNNRIRYDTVEGLDEVEPENEADGDASQVKLYVSGGEDTLYSEDPTFCHETFGGPDQFDERMIFTYRVEALSPYVGHADIVRHGSILRRAIRNYGPKLQLPYIIGLRLTWSTAREEDGGTFRWKTNMEVTVTCLVDGDTVRG